MNILNIANNGNIDRPGDRADRSESKDKIVLIPHAPVVQDKATISADGRDTLAAIETFAERARKQGSEREAIVEAARAKFANGELGSPAALEGAARRLLDSGFVAG